MEAINLVLTGRHVRLEALEHRHVDGLVAAAAADLSLYQWSPVPQGRREATQYIDTAAAWREAGSAVPFAIVLVRDDEPIGSLLITLHATRCASRSWKMSGQLLSDS